MYLFLFWNRRRTSITDICPAVYLVHSWCPITASGLASNLGNLGTLQLPNCSIHVYHCPVLVITHLQIHIACTRMPNVEGWLAFAERVSISTYLFISAVELSMHISKTIYSERCINVALCPTTLLLMFWSCSLQVPSFKTCRTDNLTHC